MVSFFYFIFDRQFFGPLPLFSDPLSVAFIFLSDTLISVIISEILREFVGVSVIMSENVSVFRKWFTFQVKLLTFMKETLSIELELIINELEIIYECLKKLVNYCFKTLFQVIWIAIYKCPRFTWITRYLV